MEPCDHGHFRRRAPGPLPRTAKICGGGIRGPRAFPSLAQSPASPRLLTNTIPAGGRGLKALVTEAAEGSLSVVAEAVAPTHSVVGTLIYVCKTVETSVGCVCSHRLSLFAGDTYLFGLLTPRFVKSNF